jgi:biotin carboxyl carrier protein
MYSVIAIEGSSERAIEIEKGSLSIDGTPLNWDISKVSEFHYHIISQGKSFNAELVNADYQQKILTLKIEDQVFEMKVKDKMDQLLEKMGIATQTASAIGEVKAPMPGLILDILVTVGQTVQKGDQLMILEAMKMENVLKAQGEGTVTSIEVVQGNSVEKNQVLIKF